MPSIIDGVPNIALYEAKAKNMHRSNTTGDKTHTVLLYIARRTTLPEQAHRLRGSKEEGKEKGGGQSRRRPSLHPRPARRALWAGVLLLDCRR